MSSRTPSALTSSIVEVVVVVSSSRPSCPYSTIACLVPVRRSTSAMIGAIRGSATPSAWCAALAGLVSGPRKLNTVGTPSSRRGTAVCRIAGWNTGAKQNPMPTSAMLAATPSGGSAIATPSASSRSALPQRPDAARLPCLATRWPAPAATSAARVDTLKVPARSPPVPQVSSNGPGTSSGAAACSIARTRPFISVAVSPLIRRPVANAAICAGVASPASTERIAAAAWSSLRSSRRSSGPSTAGQANGSDTASSPSHRGCTRQAYSTPAQPGGTPGSIPRNRAACRSAPSASSRSPSRRHACASCSASCTAAELAGGARS
jgi:hypothetical protein